MKRRRRVKARSDKVAARMDERDDVRWAVYRRDGLRCVLRDAGGCRGGLEVHEVVRRSQDAQAPYDARLCVTVCRGHHDLDVRMPVSESWGLRVPGWAWDQYGQAALDEAARLRRLRNAHATGGFVPFWREGEPGWG